MSYFVSSAEQTTTSALIGADIDLCFCHRFSYPKMRGSYAENERANARLMMCLF